jgi:hypothetical protein
LPSQVADDALAELGIEDPGGLRERTEAGARTAEFLLHLGQFAGLLDGAQGNPDGVKQSQQEQAAVLVEVQLPVLGLVPGTASVVQALEQRQELFEIREAGELLLGR